MIEDLIVWLEIEQTKYRTPIHAEIGSDGSIAIIHEPYNEPECIHYFDSLDEMYDALGWLEEE